MEDTNSAKAYDEERGKLSFLQAFKRLPPILLIETIKRLAAAGLVLLASAIMLFSTKEAMWLGGGVMALFPAYLGFNIVWQFGAEKILVARMVISKASRTRRGYMDLICRPAIETDIMHDDIDTYRIRLTPQFRDKTHFTKGTVLELYITESNPNTALAYRILGET